MIEVRKSEDRGHADHGWLNTYHTFSFANYYDPRYTHFRDLLVINDDRVKEGMGFRTHPHDNMEIVTIVLEGELEHKDSMGNGSKIHYGEVQRMTAGTGIQHSEFNPSHEKPLHLYQIWILPEEQELTPGYEQKFFTEEEKKKGWRLVASHDGDNNSIKIHQDVKLYMTIMKPDEKRSFEANQNRNYWLQILRGSVTLEDTVYNEGDGIAISDFSKLDVAALKDSELLLFDLK